MRLRRNHSKTKTPLDPRYPLRGFKIIPSQESYDEFVQVINEGQGLARAWRGSFFALKPGEKGKHGVVGE